MPRGRRILMRALAAAMIGGACLALAMPAHAETDCRRVLGNDARRHCYEAQDAAAARAQAARMGACTAASPCIRPRRRVFRTVARPVG